MGCSTKLEDWFHPEPVRTEDQVLQDMLMLSRSELQKSKDLITLGDLQTKTGNPEIASVSFKKAGFHAEQAKTIVLAAQQIMRR